MNYKSKIYIFSLLLAILCAFGIANFEVVFSALILGIPIGLAFLYVLFTYPKIGIYSIIFMSFAANGLTRYAPSLPLGLTVDALLVLTLIALALKKEKIPWHRANNPLTWAMLVWMVYNLLELFNPYASSKAAWFYAMRGVALYPLLTIPLALIFFDKKRDIQQFFIFWLGFSILGTLIGMKQLFLGVDRWEQAWLDAGAATQHILFGNLRVFSFYSDAGQFGAAQAHALVIAAILFLRKENTSKQKLFFAIAAVLSLYGMMISGTRGAMAVPAAGFMSYLFMSKNFKTLFLGFAAMFVVFALLKFTYIGQGVYAINRMRTALDPNDASLLVRLENQRMLSEYLANKPFGGGVGSAGNWGLRFSPHTFLAQTPTDSWFVKIWAEEGIVGLWLHIGILLFISISSGLRIWKLSPSAHRTELAALWSGCVGIYLASYGNGVLGQMPTGTLMYISWAFLFSKLSENHLDDENTEMDIK